MQLQNMKKNNGTEIYFFRWVLLVLRVVSKVDDVIGPFFPCAHSSYTLFQTRVKKSALVFSYNMQLYALSFINICNSPRRMWDASCMLIKHHKNFTDYCLPQDSSSLVLMHKQWIYANIVTFSNRLWHEWFLVHIRFRYAAYFLLVLRQFISLV